MIQEQPGEETEVCVADVEETRVNEVQQHKQQPSHQVITIITTYICPSFVMLLAYFIDLSLIKSGNLIVATEMSITEECLSFSSLSMTLRHLYLKLLCTVKKSYLPVNTKALYY